MKRYRLNTRGNGNMKIIVAIIGILSVMLVAGTMTSYEMNIISTSRFIAQIVPTFIISLLSLYLLANKFDK